MTNLPEERRAIMRIYAVWQKIAGDGIPKRSQIDPAAFGVDWAHCMFIDLSSGTPEAHFAYRGNVFRDHTFPSFDENCISQRLSETLLTVAQKHIPRVVAARAPLGHGGPAMLGNDDILYRIVLLPLSEDGESVDSLLGAITYRHVSEAKEMPLSDMAWCNRMGP